MVWSGKTTGDRLIENDSKSVKSVLVFDVQWSDCPVEVEDQVKDLWRLFELGNDNYIFKTEITELEVLEKNKVLVEKWNWRPTKEGQKGWVEEPIKTDLIVKYLREQGVEDDDTIWIHWWW